MKTLRAGLIGANIGRSRLSAALRKMCNDKGIEFQFEAIDTAELPDFEFSRTVDELRERDWSGVTVTHPHKAQAAAYASNAMRSEVRRIGACNTLTFRPKLVGHNTDFTGFLDAWRNVMGTKMPGKVAIAGAGGVARAVVPALLELGATEVSIWDVVRERADRLAGDFGERVLAIDATRNRSAIADADGLVNATPIGMTNYPGTAFDPAFIGSQGWCFDAVYTPTDTAFLTLATGRGLIGLSGFDLFRFMALRSFTAYTGVTPDRVTTLAKLDEMRPVGVA